MKALRVDPSLRRPSWWANWDWFRSSPASTRKAAPPAGPTLGPLEAEAIAKALTRWVQLGEAGSAAGPGSRIDSD